MLLYDKAGEEHYNLISALHKSVRNSDPDAALYWLGRMLEAGEDPLYVARRLIRMASEDIGLAEPGALGVSVAAYGLGARIFRTHDVQETLDALRAAEALRELAPEALPPLETRA